MREQQAILASRRASGGFITEAQEEEIRQRRAKVGEEEDRLKAIQQSRDRDNLEAWKSARDSGAIKTASAGLKRDADSSRMGSAGLFAERADAKMPYIDRGYVQETTSDGIPIKKKQESAPAAPNPFAGFSLLAPAPAPAPAAETTTTTATTTRATATTTTTTPTTTKTTRGLDWRRIGLPCNPVANKLKNDSLVEGSPGGIVR